MNAALELRDGAAADGSLFWRAGLIAIDLTAPQRDLLLADQDDPGEHGIGTWLLLRARGCLDDSFDLTPLGHAVRGLLGRPEKVAGLESWFRAGRASSAHAGASQPGAGV